MCQNLLVKVATLFKEGSNSWHQYPQPVSSDYVRIEMEDLENFRLTQFHLVPPFQFCHIHGILWILWGLRWHHPFPLVPCEGYGVPLGTSPGVENPQKTSQPFAGGCGALETVISELSVHGFWIGG